jgi:hypothetical protein
MNKKKPCMKWTAAENFINHLSLVIFLFQCSVVLVFGAIGNYLKYYTQPGMHYLDIHQDNSGEFQCNAIVFIYLFIFFWGSGERIQFLMVRFHVNRAFVLMTLEQSTNGTRRSLCPPDSFYCVP